MLVEKFLETVCGKSRDASKIEKKKIKGTVVLNKKNVMDCTDVCASVLDRFYEIFGKAVSFQLISSAHGDSGALIVKNHHYSQFYLKTVTLHDVPQHGTLHFVCNSWVYPAHRYEYNRVFFTNKTFLPGDTPETLRLYREEELIYLRGTGTGMLMPWDRVYDYACYNDLGSPEKGIDYSRPVLGGSKECPYPRRGRTGRPPNEKDPNSETRLPLLSLNVYVPKDEKFSQVKFSDFIGYALKSLGQVLIPEIKSLFDKTFNEFDTFQDVLNLYEGGIKLPNGVSLHKIRKRIPWELLKELLRSDGERFLKFPMPDVIKEDRTAWRTDEEFGREMLAGVNPVNIRRLEEFPPTSKLDPQVYGNQHSTMTREHIEKHMQGFTIDHAIASNRLFILDHHDAMMTYLRRINTTATKTYATRTLLLLEENGKLKPIAIELSSPHENGDKHGAVSQVFTPSQAGVEGSIWQLAKAYAAVNDSGYHQLISHWLNTHAVIEPFVIATNRQLSVLHPIYKILKPHFHDTMHINALARQILINAGGVVEATVFPARYAMEMSSAVYKNWNFTEQALPEDLLKRGMAIKDPTNPHGLGLLIDDYPYAVDGLDIWSAIEAWVNKYCRLYYPSNETIQADSELQSWWTEIREVGHGDLKNEPWWPKLHTQQELIKTCTTIIWIASALHAAVNFGQYSYAGYLPNRPTMSRRLMPKPGTREFTELESNPDSAFLKTITPQFQTLLGVSLIEILSRHSTDEIYLGQRSDPEWTDDDRARDAFREFSCELMEIEKRILERNNERRLRNRWGPVELPYTLLYPNTSDESKEGGLGVRGIPNSITI